MSNDRPKTILVVEDDQAIRETLVELLDEVNFAVQTAPDGRKALELLPGIEHTDLILVDLVMPNMGGIDFLRELRKHPNPRIASVPAIVMTASPTKSLTDELLRVGAAATLNKPLDLETLYEALRRHVRED